jgi:hypothetical protein
MVPYSEVLLPSLTTSVRKQRVSTGVRGSKAAWKSHTLIALEVESNSYGSNREGGGGLCLEIPRLGEQGPVHVLGL